MSSIDLLEALRKWGVGGGGVGDDEEAMGGGEGVVSAVGGVESGVVVGGDEDKVGESKQAVGTPSKQRISAFSELVNVDELLLGNAGDKVDGGRMGEGEGREKLTSPLPSFKSVKVLGLDKELGSWSNFVSSLTPPETTFGNIEFSDSIGDAAATEKVLKDMTKNLESFVNEYSTSKIIQSIIAQTTKTIMSNKGGLKAASENIIATAEKLALEQGLDMSDAASKARATAKYTAELVELANSVSENGYYPTDDPERQGLFQNFDVAQVYEFEEAVQRGKQFSELAGAIYAGDGLVELVHKVEHSIVASGITSDVQWIVTDHADEEGRMERVITVKGFDATDEKVERERLVNEIVRATPTFLKVGVAVHSGFLDIAKALLKEITPYVDSTAPSHRIALNGHSIGGSLAIMLLLLLTEEKGSDWCEERIRDCYTFGAPPVVCADSLETFMPKSKTNLDRTLLSFNLPQDIIKSFVQPWDPVVRLFTAEDPTYPLVGDLGEDGVTLYASGPQRVLRPLVRSVLLIAPTWPSLRDTFQETDKQKLQSVGKQYIMLPPVTQYLSDRFAAVNVNVPEVDSVMTMSSDELLPSLYETFPLDEFSISFVPAALRSFIHHFHPAYTLPIQGYESKAGEEVAMLPEMGEEIDEGLKGWV